MNISVILFALSLLIGGVVLIPAPVYAAGWISGSDEYAAPWVKEIEQELLKPEYRYLYASDPRTPQAVVLRILNQAAKAQEAEQSALAQQLVREALGVFEEGVRRHYYSEADIEPITTFIRQRVPVKTS
jgi:DNA-binding helix-hairpin-helix protein with protein kinase domain